jgi:RNA polymerase sigma factor (sigma-70 family)
MMHVKSRDAAADSTQKPKRNESTPESLLQSFLTVQDPESATTLLERLLQDHAQPLIRDVVKFKLLSFGGWRESSAEQQDICHEVVLQLLARLREMRANPGLPGIANFRGYVASSAYNACYRHLRAKHPGRWGFKNRVRYVLNRDPRFLVWHDPSNQIVCGLSAWGRSISPLSEASLSRLYSEDFRFSRVSPVDNPSSLAELLEEFLRWCGRPVLLDSLVGALAEACGVVDPQFVEVTEEPGGIRPESLRDHSLDPARSLEQKTYLGRLWHEICELPLNQRLALLLNMRDGSGSEAAMLFTQTGTTNLREFAEVLNLRFDDFLELWNQLPLDDNTISERLGLTRQQVINLRKSARKRLARRMDIWEGTREKVAAAR